MLIPYCKCFDFGDCLCCLSSYWHREGLIWDQVLLHKCALLWCCFCTFLSCMSSYLDSVPSLCILLIRLNSATKNMIEIREDSCNTMYTYSVQALPCRQFCFAKGRHLQTSFLNCTSIRACCCRPALFPLGWLQGHWLVSFPGSREQPMKCKVVFLMHRGTARWTECPMARFGVVNDTVASVTELVCVEYTNKRPIFRDTLTETKGGMIWLMCCDLPGNTPWSFHRVSIHRSWIWISLSPRSSNWKPRWTSILISSSTNYFSFVPCVLTLQSFRTIPPHTSIHLGLHLVLWKASFRQYACHQKSSIFCSNKSVLGMSCV